MQRGEPGCLHISQQTKQQPYFKRCQPASFPGRSLWVVIHGKLKKSLKPENHPCLCEASHAVTMTTGAAEGSTEGWFGWDDGGGGGYHLTHHRLGL